MKIRKQTVHLDDSLGKDLMHARSAEREREGLHARSEELDLEQAIGDGLGCRIS